MSDKKDRVIIMQAIFKCPKPKELCKQNPASCILCMAEYVRKKMNDLEVEIESKSIALDLSENELERMAIRFQDTIAEDSTIGLAVWRRDVETDLYG